MNIYYWILNFRIKIPAFHFIEEKTSPHLNEVSGLPRYDFRVSLTSYKSLKNEWADRTTPACSWPWLLRDIPLVQRMELGIWFSSSCRSVICSIRNSISSLLSGTGLSSFVQINIYPCQASLPGSTSVLLLSEAKANPLYCIRSSWLGWYIKHIGILLVRCDTHICQCQSSNRIHSHCLKKTWRISSLWAWKTRWSPRIKGKRL